MARLVTILVAVIAVFATYMWFSGSGFDSADVKGKRVLITGASQGIGKQIAYHYCRLGAHVVVVARRESVLKEVVSKCKEISPDVDNTKISYIAANLDGNVDIVDQVVQKTIKELGKLDHLVLNHIKYPTFGLWNKSAMLDLPKELDVNVVSYVQLATYFLEYLKATNGSIGVVSSAAGKFPYALVAGYSATKFALDGFFSTLRQELVLRQEDVSITLCILGAINTYGDIQWEAFAKRENLDVEEVKAKYSGYLAPSEDAGIAIIEATTTRQRELYYPGSQWIKTKVLLRHFMPQLLDYLQIQLTNSYM